MKKTTPIIATLALAGATVLSGCGVGEASVADEVEATMRACMGKRGPKWKLELISDRPPMGERRVNTELARVLERTANRWEIPLKRESSVWPSVAGLVGNRAACVCGLGPVARDLGTPQEAVQRISLVQRTLLLADYLGGDRDAREQYQESPHYDRCVEFCAEYDQNCFDPDYDTLPLSAFEPLLRAGLSEPQGWV